MPKRTHLRRLGRVFERYDPPLLLVTCCVRDRAPVLATPSVVQILKEAWQEAQDVHRWLVGRWVVMPDHVHFFCTPLGDRAKELGQFLGCWKRWTCRQIRKVGLREFNWQAEFFDHLMRSQESYQAKWEYVRANPVRGGLVQRPDDWSFQGEAHSLRW